MRLRGEGELGVRALSLVHGSLNGNSREKMSSSRRAVPTALLVVGKGGGNWHHPRSFTLFLPWSQEVGET